MKRAKWLFAVILMSVPLAARADSDEVDAEIENSIGDSEAAQALEQQLSREKIRTRNEASRREYEAANVKAKAKIRQEAATAKIAAHESELMQLKARIRTANNEILKQEKFIAAAEKAEAAKATLAKKAREQLEAANKLRSEQRERLEDLRQKTEVASAELAQTNAKIKEARVDFKRRQKEETRQRSRLEALKTKRSRQAASSNLR